MSGGILLKCSDKTIRDLADLRGRFKVIEKTYQAISIIALCLKELQVSKINVYIDAPVSNSKRLKNIFEEVFFKL